MITMMGMTKEDGQGRRGTAKLALAILFVLCCATPAVLAVGYGPISVIGTVLEDGVPVEDAVVTLHATQTHSESVAVVTNEEGMFFAVLTVPDPGVLDVEVRIERGGELFIEVVRDARVWEEYHVVIDLSQDDLSMPAPAAVVARPPSPPGFDEDMDDIAEGEALRDGSLVEKYDIIIEDLPASPASERPSVVGEKELSFWRRIGWEVAAALLLLGSVLVLRHELRKK
jgi:hypothetical protein